MFYLRQGTWPAELQIHLQPYVIRRRLNIKGIIMENNGTKQSLYERAIKETKKPGFLKALTVFFCCVIIGLILGFIFDEIQLAFTIGVGLGLVWMGVAYFNQKEE